jgi:hypothetical protein
MRPSTHYLRPVGARPPSVRHPVARAWHRVGVALWDWEAIISGAVGGGVIAALTEIFIKPSVDDRRAKRTVRDELRTEARELAELAVGVVTLDAPADAERIVREAINQRRDDLYLQLVQRAAQLQTRTARYLDVYNGPMGERAVLPYLSTVSGMMLSRRDRTTKAEYVRDISAQFLTVIEFVNRSRLRKVTGALGHAIRVKNALDEIERIRVRSHERDGLPPAPSSSP